MVTNSRKALAKLCLGLTSLIIAMSFKPVLASAQVVSLICKLEGGAGPVYEFTIPIADGGRTYGNVTLVGQDAIDTVTDDVRWIVGASNVKGRGQGVCAFDYCDSKSRDVYFEFDRRDLSMTTEVYVASRSSFLTFDIAAFTDEAKKTMDSDEVAKAVGDKMDELMKQDSSAREEYQCSKIENPKLAF